MSSSDLGRWNEAAGWGDHSEAGYLTSEVDPAFSSSPAGSITDDDLTRWDGAVSTEIDPAFTGSPAAGIAAADISRWDGHDHDTRYYTRTESDARYQARAAPQHLNLNATDFVPRALSDDLDYLAGQAIRFGAAPAYNLMAAVHLPDGATITTLTCYLRATDDTQDFVGTSRAQLATAAIPDYGSSFDILATADLLTSGAAGVVTTSGTAFGGPVVNNAAYQYLVKADFEISGLDSDFFDPIFRGCTIAYLAP